MLSLRTLNLIALLLLGCGLAAGNVWIAAIRSTIPIAVSGTITEKFVRHEKHPPKDDVHFLRFADGKLLHVDTEVTDACQVGDQVVKQAWSKSLVVNGQPTSLTYSTDLTGMLVVMQLLVLIGLVTGIIVATRNSQQQRSTIVDR